MCACVCKNCVFVIYVYIHGTILSLVFHEGVPCGWRNITSPLKVKLHVN